jgi:hypothetical protein
MGNVRDRSTRMEWLERVRRWKASGLTAEAFAAREGTSAATLSWWRWRLAREGERIGKARRPAGPGISRTSFVEITGAGVRAVRAGAGAARRFVMPGGAGAGVRIDGEALARLLAGVAKPSRRKDLRPLH